MDTKQTVRSDYFTCFCTYYSKHEVQFCASLISEHVRTLVSYLVGSVLKASTHVLLVPGRYDWNSVSTLAVIIVLKMEEFC
jgi:hypothetical protein